MHPRTRPPRLYFISAMGRPLLLPGGIILLTTLSTIFRILHPSFPSLLRHARSAYLLQHILPIPIWLLCSAVQLSVSIRKLNPHLHKISGRIMVATSLYMTLTATLLLLREHTIGPDFTAASLISLRPTFANAAFLIAIHWTLCTAKLITSARRRNFRAHRYWTVQYLAVGYNTAAVRLLVASYMAFCYARGTPLSDEDYERCVGFVMWLVFVSGVLIVHIALTRPKCLTTNKLN